ncbi:hypothetical protein SAMN06297144_0259 [Sphingomonas guangdongensis]|uniref:Uncharacterized protein n=1 Tax=Sphingomonas guangdongensis TaxID=1141890 RepID=A0A285QAM2_9SPHN|nr:hypothetical protein SAMN06297144_0259 [Sphingomonas guangdongensis]
MIWLIGFAALVWGTPLVLAFLLAIGCALSPSCRTWTWHQLGAEGLK